MSISKEEKLLATGNIGTLFRKFGIPAIIGLLFFGLQPVVDGLFLGNYVGPEALAGVNIFMPIYSFVSASAVVVGIGCQTVVSISLGQNRHARAHNAFKTAAIFMFLSCVLVSVVCVIGAEPISKLLGADEVLMPYTVNYMRTFAPFFPLMVLVWLGDYILKATGRPFFSLFLLGLILGMNIVLDFLFIRCLGWGVQGAACATGLGLTSAFIILYTQLLKGSTIVSLRKGKFSVPLLVTMLYNGSSEGFSELASGITVLLFNWVMMSNLGADGVAAFTTVNYVLFLGVQLFLGLSEGIIPILSYNFGAGSKERMRRTLLLGFRTNATIGVIFFISILFGADEIMRMFYEGDAANGHVEKILSISSVGASIVSFAFLLNGANILSSSFFTSMGDARTSAYISMLRGLVMTSFGLLIYPLFFGEYGIWLVIPVAEVVTAFYTWHVLRKKAPWVFNPSSSFDKKEATCP